MSQNERAVEVVTALGERLRQFIFDYQVNESELIAALEFLTEVGQAEEFHALADALALSTAADNVTYEQSETGTLSNIPGPFYREGAPFLSPPHRLAPEEEPGDVLVFMGTVADGTTGQPVSDVLLDVWQANAQGVYENQDPNQPDFNLRGRLSADANGRFEFRTVLPGAYEVSKAGSVGRLLTLLGRHAFRPKHIHFKLTREGYQPLTTQIYFQGDEWLDSDSIGAAKPELATELHKFDSDSEAATSRRIDRPFFIAEYHFRLRPRP
jgi:protocatechuate 3,4-dioxygenase beta subunit